MTASLILPYSFNFKNLLNFGTSLFELHIDLQIYLILKMLNYFTEGITYNLKFSLLVTLTFF